MALEAAFSGTLNGTSEVEDGSYPEFLEFYKQTTGNDSTDNNNLDDMNRPDFPRLLHNNIDEFEYFTVEKFNGKFSNSNKQQLSLLNINIRGIQ